MKTPNLPFRRLIFLAAAVVFALLPKEAFAQKERSVEKGLIRIKVTEELAARIESRITYSVDNIDSLNPAYVGKLGKGRINAERALQEGDKMPPSKAGPPILAVPESFHENLRQGVRVNRTLLLTNSGSQDVSYRIDMTNIRAVNGLKSLSADTTAFTKARQRQYREDAEAVYATKSPEQRKLLKVFDGSSSASRAQSLPWKYTTGFEDFSVGRLDEQQGWTSSDGFSISRENPDKGLQHLQGVTNFSTGDVYAFSPFFGEEGPYYQYSYMTVRLNIPPSKSTWDVIPIGGLNAAVIRFNADRTIDAIVGEDDYNARWERVPLTTPEGYFELAIALKNEFSDTTFNPYYSAFINHQHIFSGVGLTSQIYAVAFDGDVSEQAVIDIDELEYGPGEFVPKFIKADPNSGIIPAGKSVNVGLTFDASGIDFGYFEADLLIRIEEYDSVVVPVTMAINGPAAIVVHPTPNDILRISAHKNEEAIGEMTINNTGGRPVRYRLESGIPNLHFAPSSGTLNIRETNTIAVTYDGQPGLFIDQLKIYTDFLSEPMTRAVEVNIRDSATLFYAPQTVRVDIPQGQISTHTFQVRNDGLNAVSFSASAAPLISVDPAKGSVAKEPSTITLTIDGRVVSVDQQNLRIEFKTNDSNQEYFYTTLLTNVVPDAEHYGKISQEIWTNLPGSKISSIPANVAPSRTNVLYSFEAPRNQDDLFGSRIRGDVIPLYTGDHTFWISSNDNSELWLSSDDSPIRKKKIASVTGFTNPLQYDKYASQRSEPVYLEQNKRYYIEALHKEVVGADHIAVAWQIPGGEVQSPIPGIRLARYEDKPNEAPTITLMNPQPEQVFPANSSIDINAEARDADGTIVKVEFFDGSEKLGIDITSPYTFSWKSAAPGSYTLIASALDNLGGTYSDTVDIVVSESPSCADAGHIVREQWNNLTGTAISVIPVQTPPSLTETLTTFDVTRNVGDYYGTRIRGFLCPPQSGQYIFWIASNDKSELWLSTDESPSHKIKIAYVSGYTDYQEWSKYPSQQSASIALEAGRKYYVEALHKEVVGTDHLSVGWQLPDRMTMERPIQGIRLLPYYPSANKPPTVAITGPKEGARYTEPATIRIDASAKDDDGRITRVEFFNGTQKIGEDLTNPYSITLSNVASGRYTLTAVATDNSGSITSTTVHVNVASICSLVGSITRDYWTGIAGNLVVSIPVNDPPDGSESLRLFESPDASINYGARIRGYICPPATGDYYFWIASNDQGELWLSTDDKEENKERIAFVTRATNPREWTRFASQKSAAIHLTQNTPYYIEALHKQGLGADHVSVGWRLPDGTLERPIGGNRLSAAKSLSAARLSSARLADDSKEESSITLGIYPNPVTERTFTIDVDMGDVTTPVPRRMVILKLTGLAVYSKTDICSGNCSAEIVVPHDLSPGIYILQVTLKGRTVTRKLFIR